MQLGVCGHSSYIPSLVVDLVSKSGCIHNCQGDTSALLIKLQLCATCQNSIVCIGGVSMFRTNGDGLDLDTLFDVGAIGVICLLMAEDALSAEGVDEGCSAWR